jgi:hypothetical protein
MHSKDRSLSKKLMVKLAFLIFVLLMPFSLSSLLLCQSISGSDSIGTDFSTSSDNSYLVAGSFQDFNINLDFTPQKICIIAYYGNSLPDSQERSESNYYKWEYDRGKWYDTSGHIESYIKPNKCKKVNKTYSFNIGIDNKANPGQWSIKIFVDNKEIKQTTPTIFVVTSFNLFLSAFIGIFEPEVGNKKLLNKLIFFCSERKKVTLGLKKYIDNVKKHNFNTGSLEYRQKKIEEIHDLCYIGNIQTIENELSKSNIVSYSSSKLKNDKFPSNHLLINHKNKGDGKGFLTCNSTTHKKILVFILTLLLICFVYVPSIATIKTPPTISIINVHSYPVVGGKWIVMFKTIGTANLTITAVNETTWNNYGGNYDLKFLEINDGSNVVNTGWVNNSVFIANYSSNEIGYEISEVLTPGKHTLLFRFGNDMAYANNLASNYWLQTTNSDFNNGTITNINVSNGSFHLNETYYIRNYTLINNESFEGSWPPLGWTETGLLEQWNAEDNQVHSGYYSADFDGGRILFFIQYFGNLLSPIMNCSDSSVTAIYVDSWNYEDGADNGDYYLDYYDGNTWDQITRLDNLGSGSWAHYTDTITDNQYFVSNFQIRWRVTSLDTGEHVYVDDVSVTVEKNESGYVNSGSIISDTHDTGQLEPIYTNIILNNTIPNGTSIASWIRAADTEANLSTAIWHTDISDVPHKRWVQWRINLMGNENLTPIVHDVNLTWGYDVEKPNSSVDPILPYWQNLNPFEITATASDNETGIKEVALYYNYSADNISGWIGWTLFGINDTISPYNWSFNHPQGDGYYRFYSIAIDNENNTEDVPPFPGYDTICGVDTVKPTSQLFDITPYWYNDSTRPVIINTSFASDSLSGLKNVLLYYRYRIDNSSSWGSWEYFDVDDTTPWIWSFNFPKATGHYQFYSVGVDIASNYEDPPIIPNNDTECGYNSTKPFSEVDDVEPYWTITTPVNISSQAIDFSGSGLSNVTLYYYFSLNNISWLGPFTFGVDSDPWIDIIWDFTFPLDDGYYRFYSIARDNDSNIEYFTGNDTICGYDSGKPFSKVDIISPYWYDSSGNPLLISVTNTGDNLSGLKNISLHYRFRVNNESSWSSWTLFGQDTSPPWSWSFNFPDNVGHYQFLSIANDTAGNKEDFPSVADASCGYDITRPSSSVDPIKPYTIWSSPLSLSATTTTDEVRNITLWYRWSNDNQSWNSTVDTISVDRASSSEGSTSSSISWYHTTGNYNNRTLVVCSSVNEDSSDNWPNPVTDWIITNITYNGVALTKANSEVLIDTTFLTYYYTSAEIWYLHTPPVGNHEIIITYNGTINYCSVGALSIYNVSQQAPEATNTNTRRSTSLISTGIMTLSPGAMVIDAVASGQDRTFVPGADQTEFFDNNTAGGGGAGSYKLPPMVGSTSMVQTASSSTNRLTHVTVSFAPTISQNGIAWREWSNTSNPDTNYPWSWNFNFPNGTGYYQFYSIAIDNYGNDEYHPLEKDAECYYNPDLSSAPIINSYDLRNSTGSKLNNITGLLDINKEYYFTINITDSNKWANIDYIEIKAWFDNGTESSFYNETFGGNLNLYLQYENTTGTANFTLIWPDDEIQFVPLNCSEVVVNNVTRIINFSFILGSQIRWAPGDGTWDITKNTTNDLYSWNVNITVTDEDGLTSSKTDEYGVYKYTSISPDHNWINVYTAPGFNDSSSIVTITYSSNYEFNMTIFFEENLTNETFGTYIPIENNVDILANADTSDDINFDITFLGIGESYALDIFNQSGIFHVDNNSQTVRVQFDVYVPLGTLGGKYSAHVATKIFHD